MTLRNGLFFENNTTDQHAQDVRLMLKALLGGTTGSVAGVGGATHFKVTEKAGTPDMSVDVAAGHLFIEGSRNSSQGVYHVYNDATVNVALSASDPTNPRIDLIYVRLRDSAYDAGFTGDDDAEIVVAEGTPAAVPAAPTITDEDYLLLAAVTVGANVSAIENADIEDRRVASPSWLAPRGRVGYAQSTTTQTSIGNTPTGVTGLTLTVTYEAGRVYRVSSHVHVQKAGAAGDVIMRIHDAGGEMIRNRASYANGDQRPIGPVLPNDTGSGEVTRSVVAQAAAGTLDITATNNTPNWIMIEDIGGFLL